MSLDVSRIEEISVISVIPLALYIHIPWCVKKCPYCDFNSHELPAMTTVDDKQIGSSQHLDKKSSHTSKEEGRDNDALMQQQYIAYVDALIADIQSQLALVQGRTITSIFIGGGTPSLLPVAQYERLFTALRSVLPLAPDIEITMEANPGTLEHAPFEQYLELGINRLSIGVQSFNDDALQRLGRIHNPTQAVQAIINARRAGFKRVNVDLMHGLPKQKASQALFDIQQAYDAGATHISWYQLTIEPNTVFYRNTPVLPDEDNLEQIETQGSELLTLLGFSNYEVSAWVSAKDNPCRHNLTYWQFGDYLAIGAGAHGKVSIYNSASQQLINSDSEKDSNSHSEADSIVPEAIKGSVNGIYRFSKSRMPKDYMNYKDNMNDKDNVAVNQTAEKAYPKMVGWRRIPEDELASEFMMNALRLTQGINVDKFTERTGLSYQYIAPQLAKLEAQGLINFQNEHIIPTVLGRRYINKVIQAFL